MVRSAIPAAAAACAVLVSGCGGAAPHVSERDADAVFSAFSGEAQLVARQDCRSLRSPVTPGTRRAHEVMLRVARENPDAMLRSQDFVGLEWRMGDYVSRRAENLSYCLSRVRSPAPGWRTLRAELRDAAAAMGR